MRLVLLTVSFLGVACSDYDLVGHDKSKDDGGSDGAGDGDDGPDGATDLGDCTLLLTLEQYSTRAGVEVYEKTLFSTALLLGEATHDERRDAPGELGGEL